MHKAGYLHSEINERVSLLETRTEYLKLQKLLQDIEMKEKELDKRTKKSEGSDNVQAVKGIKGGK